MAMSHWFQAHLTEQEVSRRNHQLFFVIRWRFDRLGILQEYHEIKFTLRIPCTSSNDLPKGSLLDVHKLLDVQIQSQQAHEF